MPVPYPSSDALQKRLHEPVSAITAYDYPTGRLCDEAGVQLILVGDSLGMVVAGHEDTTSVTLDQMVYHTEMVRRGVKRAVLVSDLPINTYQTPEMALKSARQLMNVGADAVKLEGGFQQIAKIEMLVDAGISVCAHIGMLPQRVREEGGYKKKGKEKIEADRLVESAKALQDAGCFAIVLESMIPEVAGQITSDLTIPTIGIGAGEHCDGQIRVFHDVVGAYPWFVPPFAKVYGNVAEVIQRSVTGFCDEISNSRTEKIPDS